MEVGLLVAGRPAGLVSKSAMYLVAVVVLKGAVEACMVVPSMFGLIEMVVNTGAHTELSMLSIAAVTGHIEQRSVGSKIGGGLALAGEVLVAQSG